ncbi:deoxyguanosinetriphosphate triphosphohydrolase [Pseudogemmobacter faecipullorum]|uniref:Deoxyguanosinetriphosphate triphosphohydrolase-like protein n=1 Tax=Pseudogemmobacter faecipullorum TaxID=2755041 RepID=A0ABS8CIV6_9RHOB|nr:deoxyguanosinetriphosphate triphosphohydrolase [Pseudogemmobacter faecipullorum]MCB5409123.1 deoxyguanosinetriphosphate triphosphohydrolase [Pseudogemmobacter faecipullorum]
MLAPYACQPDASRGRLFDEGMSTFRSPFQRDRDRIIHASAFRRLKHKTQVFVEHEGDYYRTRLTHSIEVAQVARTIAGVLGLNTDLAEAIALAHDLGHTPFGHTGEDALARLMAPYGGFDHNAQALRIVTRLERHYAGFDGLNLTWETLEGIAKHNGPVTGPNADARHAHDPAHLPYALDEVNQAWDLELSTHASAEAQVAAIADDVAYSHHDLHDGLRSGLFTEEDLMALPVTGPAFEAVDRLYPGLDRMRRRHEALRRVFGRMVEDVIHVAKNRLEAAQPKSVDEIRHMGTTIIRFSKPLYQELKSVRGFLFQRMYRAPSVMVMREKVTGVMDQLFPLFMEQPGLLPEEWQADVAAAGGEVELARIIGDYVAGMTDRFAIQEHARLFDCAPVSERG